jgi:hypothetical protein
MHAHPSLTDTAAELSWPTLCPPPGIQAAAPAGTAHDVCTELERRLRLLDHFKLPAQVARDVDEMACDLDELRRLLPHGQCGQPVPDRASRLLADLRAWLPVCEAWIGATRAGACA